MKYKERYIQVEINSVVNDACLQYLHCTDKDQQSKTVWLSTAEIEVYDTIAEFHMVLGGQPTTFFFNNRIREKPFFER